MACIAQPECNFLHGYFRCRLPVELVDMEVKITSMQGTHIFRRYRTTQVIKCTLWSSRLHLHPTIIKKMRTFLEVEEKLGLIPQPSSNQYRPPQPDTNANIRKAIKTPEKRKRVAPTKKFKTNIAARPNEAATQPPMTISKAPTDAKIQAHEETPESRPLPLEDAPIHTGTPGPDAGKMLGNLFEARKDWLLPPSYIDDTKRTANITIPKPPIKVEAKTEGQSSTSPKAENCHFCKNQKEDWDGDHQKQLQMQLQPKQKIQMTPAQCSQTLSYQKPQSFQKFY